MDEVEFKIKEEVNDDTSDTADKKGSIRIKGEWDFSDQPNNEEIQFLDWQLKREEVEVSDYEFPVESDSGGETAPLPRAENATCVTCACCSRDFGTKKALTRHVRKRCCKSLFPRRAAVDAIGGKTPRSGGASGTATADDKCFECQTCRRRYKTKRTFSAHMRWHAGVNLRKCLVCGKSFTNKSHMSIHMRVHTGEKPFQCKICQKSYQRKDKLTAHAQVHSGVKPFQCKDCGKHFTVKEGLEMHMLIHSGEKPFQCGVCCKRFRHKGSLVDHLCLHSGVKPHKCHVCDKGFTARTGLAAHGLIHVKEKLLKCKLCHKLCEPSRFSAHLRWHASVKQPECPVCGRQFNTKSMLNRHMPVHTGEKPFQCDVCKKCYSRRDVLITHLGMHSR